jgi:uncharacterized protein
MLGTLLKSFFIFLLKLYQVLISPFYRPCCRFHPTCTRYAIEAIEKHGPIRGFLLMSKRLIKCHPWGDHGYDPVPKLNKRNKRV